MRVISRKLLREYWVREPATEGQLKAWFAEAEQADWKGPADVKRKYGNASILKSDRVVFNICGNKYRLIVKINYKFRVVYVRFVGTHAEYDEIDAETI
jgi:mRNA interferase HigB